MFYNKVTELFENKSLFAELVDEIDTRKFEFEEEWTTGEWKGGINTRIIILKRKEELDNQKAFAVLYKYILLYWEGWEPDFVIYNNESDRKKWKESLKDGWIPNYFPERDLTLKMVDVNKFFEYGDFEVDPNGDFKKIVLKSKMIEIIGYNNMLYFGMTDEVYFYLETIHNA